MRNFNIMELRIFYCNTRSYRKTSFVVPTSSFSSLWYHGWRVSPGTPLSYFH